MIIRTGGVDKALGVHLQKIYNTQGADSVARADRRDAVTISKFSALVERGRACAMSLPDIRADRVSQARLSLEMGDEASGADIASAMINGAIEGKV